MDINEFSFIKFLEIPNTLLSVENSDTQIILGISLIGLDGNGIKIIYKDLKSWESAVEAINWLSIRKYIFFPYFEKSAHGHTVTVYYRSGLIEY